MLSVLGWDRAAEQQEKADDAVAEGRSKVERAQAEAGKATREIQEDVAGKIAAAQAAFLRIREDL